MTGRLRWGVLGARSWIAREAVVPAIRQSRNGKLAAIASRNADELGSLYEDGVRIRSYEELIADDGVDAIYIPLPNSMHFEWAKRAAEAGKPVLCEKPLGLNASETIELADIFQRHGVKLMEGFMYRFHPQHRRVREIIDSGAIGEVLEVHAHLSVDLMSPVDPNNVRFKPELGGGALLDMGCYGVSAARLIFNSEPISVSAWWQIDEELGVDVAAAGVLEFADGVGVASCSFKGNGNGFYHIIGRKGMIEAPRALILGAGPRPAEAIITVADADGRRREERLEPFKQYVGMVEEFADAVLLDRPVPLPLSDSINNAKVLDAFARSAREGRRVAISAAATGGGRGPRERRH